MCAHKGKEIIIPEGAGDACDPVEQVRPVRRVYGKKPGKGNACQGPEAGFNRKRLLRTGNDRFRKKGQIGVRLSAEILPSFKNPLRRPGRQIPVPVLAGNADAGRVRSLQKLLRQAQAVLRAVKPDQAGPEIRCSAVRPAALYPAFFRNAFPIPALRKQTGERQPRFPQDDPFHPAPPSVPFPDFSLSSAPLFPEGLCPPCADISAFSP